MGFQVGTKVDPRLMAVDYTPMIRAGEIAADSISNMGKNIGNAIGAYQDTKKQDKVFAQTVKSSLAMTDAMMQNLPPEQAEELAQFATSSGVNDENLSMKDRAQAAKQFGASLSAIIDSIKGPGEVTYMEVPGGTAVMQGGKVIKVIRDDTMNFGGTPNQPVDPAKAQVAAEMAELENL
tara:strand:- start:136 stop:672 length:537 start_codon:yes stop_codon:yes gene_type:complete